MKLLKLLALLWLIPDLTGTFAQTPSLPAPKNPMVHRAPVFASWTITFAYKEAAPMSQQEKPAASANLIQSITVTKTDKTYWEQTTWKSGKKEDKWIFDGTQFETMGNGKSIIIISPPTPEEPSPDYLDYSRGDFSDLGWVSSGNYKGVDTYQGNRAFRFEADEKKALLSVETQLPLYSSDREVSSTYTYNPPPTAPLTLPKRFLAVLETYKRGLEAQKYHPSPP